MECVSCSYQVSPGWRNSAIAANLSALTNGTREDLEGGKAIAARRRLARETARGAVTLNERGTLFQILGILGVAISVAAYVPQVAHLWREGCSAGVSSRAWAMWLISSVLILTLALHQRQPVFIALPAINLASITVTLLLARKYRGMVCDSHAYLASRRPATTTGRAASPVSGINSLPFRSPSGSSAGNQGATLVIGERVFPKDSPSTRRMPGRP
jgi:lipid-A-disaccharide synthase-like uncharacterized protein